MVAQAVNLTGAMCTFPFARWGRHKPSLTGPKPSSNRLSAVGFRGCTGRERPAGEENPSRAALFAILGHYRGLWENSQWGLSIGHRSVKAFPFTLRQYISLDHGGGRAVSHYVSTIVYLCPPRSNGVFRGLPLWVSDRSGGPARGRFCPPVRVCTSHYILYVAWRIV